MPSQDDDLLEDLANLEDVINTLQPYSLVFKTKDKMLQFALNLEIVEERMTHPDMSHVDVALDMACDLERKV